jgi:hypothetical protein
LFGKNFTKIGIYSSLSKIEILRRFIDDTEQCSKKDFKQQKKLNLQTVIKIFTMLI